METVDKLQLVKDNIRSIPDFPKPGVIFQDIFSLTKNPEAFEALLSLMVDHAKTLGNIDAIVGLDSRGFLIGPHLALSLNIPFVPIRKKGKLPGPVLRVEYALEYGVDSVEIQKDSILPGQSVLIVDDLIATGGTLDAACQLIDTVGGKVVQCFVVMELQALKGRDLVKYPVHALIVY